jgi:hypothetical protein
MYFFLIETYYEFQLLKALAYLFFFLNYIKSRVLLMIKLQWLRNFVRL